MSKETANNLVMFEAVNLGANKGG